MSDVVEVGMSPAGEAAAPAKPWVLDEESRERTAAELAAIDIMQEESPRCVVCGQRAARLDKFGCCSKTSDPHREHRAEARSGVSFR